MHTHRNAPTPRGSALLFTLFFSSLFLVGFGALLSYIVVQHNAVREEVWKAQALTLADAGTQYYRWHLAHAPSDYATDTGVHTYDDPYGGTFGTYEITVSQPSAGSTIAIITTAGSPSGRPAVSARLRTRYGKRSIANYAFLSNSNVWFGDTESIDGPMHSNGGVRMDGTGNSAVTSEQETYICGAEHSCANETKPGVWGTGTIASLWEYPVNQVDFDAFSLDLTSMQTAAIANGIHLDASGGYGYYVDFHANGTITINAVTAVHNPVTGYNGSAWVSESIDKRTWSPVSGYNNIAVPPNGLIFLEDNVWVGGTLNGRATVVAARMPIGSAPAADIYIQDSTRYLARDGAHALALIAQQDVLVPLRSDNNLVIDAALMAINGHTFRYYYPSYSIEPYRTYALRNSIQTYGILVTNTLWTWSWVNDSNAVIGGYRTTDTVYDPDLLYAPPPYFPTENDYSFISWEQLTLNEP